MSATSEDILDKLIETAKETGSFKFNTQAELMTWLASDFKNFLFYVCKWHGFKIGRLQLLLADALQSGHSTVLIQCFRGASKSFVVDCYIIWRWMLQPNLKILILSAKERGGARHIINIRRIIQRCPAIGYLKFSKATATSLRLAGTYVEGEESLMVAGVYSNIEGLRADLLIMDDCETKVNSGTQELRNKLLEQLSQASAILHPLRSVRHYKDASRLPTAEATGRVIVGTPQTEFSIYNPPEDDTPHPFRDAHRVVIPVFHKNVSTFPELMPTEVVHFKKRTMTTPAFALQMMLDPKLMDQAEAVIKLERLKTKAATTYDNVLFVDPVGEDGTGKDEVGLCIAGIDSADKLSVHVSFWTGIKNQPAMDVVNYCLDVAKGKNVSKIVVESNFGAYATLFQREAIARKMNVQVFGRKSFGRKLTRLIETLEVPLHSERVSFAPETLKDANNLYQLKTFKFGSLAEPNDRLDALSMAMAYHEEKGCFKYSSAFKFEKASIKY